MLNCLSIQPLSCWAIVLLLCFLFAQHGLNLRCMFFILKYPLLFLWVSLLHWVDGERAQEKPCLCFKPEKTGSFWLGPKCNFAHRQKIFASVPPSFVKSSVQDLSHKHRRVRFHFQVNVKCKHWSASTLKPQAVDVNSSYPLATVHYSAGNHWLLALNFMEESPNTPLKINLSLQKYVMQVLLCCCIFPIAFFDCTENQLWARRISPFWCHQGHWGPSIK